MQAHIIQPVTGAVGCLPIQKVEEIAGAISSFTCIVHISLGRGYITSVLTWPSHLHLSMEAQSFPLFVSASTLAH